ncbi:MAG: sulfite exporter TauE/SafE family protein [Nitrospirales bacterium]|nr:sulfite exporter TauE/SafE family protein [Nitrospirales bacterium]
MDVTLLDFIAAGFVIALGATLQAATGLGAGLIVVPLLALIHLEFVPGPVIFASFGLSLLMTLVGRDAINRVHLHTVSIGLILGMLIGAVSLSRLAPDHLGAMFGLLILLAVFLTALGIRLQFTTPNILVAGAVSGFMGMTAAVGAPILALLYQYEKGNTLRATLAFLYLFSSVGMLLLLHLMGRFQWHELLLGVGLFPGILIGYALASRVASHVDRGYSRYAVLIISAASALVLVVKSVR